jgi:hypothetical protein
MMLYSLLYPGHRLTSEPPQIFAFFRNCPQDRRELDTADAKDVPNFPHTITSFLRVQTFYVAYLEKVEKVALVGLLIRFIVFSCVARQDPTE